MALGIINDLWVEMIWKIFSNPLYFYPFVIILSLTWLYVIIRNALPKEKILVVSLVLLLAISLFMSDYYSNNTINYVNGIIAIIFFMLLIFKSFLFLLFIALNIMLLCSISDGLLISLFDRILVDAIVILFFYIIYRILRYKFCTIDKSWITDQYTSNGYYVYDILIFNSIILFFCFILIVVLLINNII